MLATDVLSFHNDVASNGVNATETQLTPANVKVGSFGKLYGTAVDGQVYAQPLVQTAVTISSGPNTTPGSTGVHDVVFVATENDTLYALDAGIAGGAVLWKRSLTDITAGAVGTVPGTNINNTLSATAIAPVPYGNVGTADISPVIGITGTPVIDAATGTLYVNAKTKETIGGVAHYVSRVHAISVADGTDRAVPYLVGDTSGTNTNNTQIYVYGSGDGAVTDPYNGTGRQVVQFNALRENQRASLSLVGKTLYVPWASHGDNGPYHGWVTAWDVSALTTTGFRLSGVLNTSPNGGLGGIWQGGGKLSFEADGSAFYFETGNGPSNAGAPVLNASGFPVDANYYESLVKAVPDAATSPTNQNANGWGIKVADYFIPYNQTALDGTDQDFGSGAPLVLPDSAGIPGHPHLIVAAGKQGKIYVVDRDNLGKFNAVDDNVLNAVPDGTGHKTPPVQLGGSVSTPSYFNGRLYWVSGFNSRALSYRINSDGTLTIMSSTGSTFFGYLPGSLSVSANGTSNGIVWVPDRNTNALRAFDSATLSTELWNSGQQPADAAGALVKFAAPTVANGKVYVGTTNGLVVYGLTPPPVLAPSAPVLAAQALSGTSVVLSWTDPTVSPNVATGYSIEQLINGVYQQVTTAPAGATSISIGGLTSLTTYSFRVRGFNSLGNSAYSNVASVTTSDFVPVVDFSGGFAGSTAKLTYNGSAIINGTRARLTSGSTYQVGSVFTTSPVDVTRFRSSFQFQSPLGSNTADGFTFTIQGVGPTALGSFGGGLGYGPDGTNSPAAIGRSVAVKFDLANNSGEGSNSTGLYVNGTAPTGAGSIDLTASGVDLHSGNVFLVTLAYDTTKLSVTITDTVTGKSASQSYTVDIVANAGASAYVGFTAGTGAATAIQDVVNWTYSPNVPQAPAAPSGLGAVPASATSVALSWTNNATNQTGFVLDRAFDAGFTQGLVSQTLPATPNSFTDTLTGLAPGGTFYYRLRATNSAGSSANSNVASVTIPLAPAKPTDAAVTLVTTGEIDLTWTDNAGRTADGYRILRAVNHGAFDLYASLPSFNATPPSTYAWSDTGVQPATFYEYHIQAYNVAGYNDFTGTGTTTLTLAPTALAATAASNAVTLAWTAPAGAVASNVYRGTAPGAESLLTANVAGTSYTDTTAVSGTRYYYVVTAVNGNIAPVASESARSNEVTASALPAAPSGLGAVATSATGVALSWTNNDTNQTGFVLDRAVDAGFTQGLVSQTLPATPNSFTDTLTGLAPGGTFYYRLRATNSAGSSASSNVASVTVPLAPAKPTNAAVTLVTTGQVGLTWTDNAGRTADGYRILRAVNHGAFNLYASLPAFSVTPPSTATWSDTGVQPATFYEYRIQAYNVSGSNDFTGTGTTTLTLAPTALAATAASNAVTLAWTAPAGAVASNVYRGTAPGAESLLTANVAGTSYTDTTAVSGTRYYYVVTAVNGNIAPVASESARSNEVTALPPANSVPTAPVVSGVALSSTAVSLSWTDATVAPNTASGYAIDQLVNGTYQQVATAPAGATAATVGGLTVQTGYSFRIRGINVLGSSVPSNVVSVTTANGVPAIDQSAGFAGSTTRLVFNGSTAVSGTRARLTASGATYQSGSVFSFRPVDVTRFNTSFQFQTTAGSATADGFTFTIQGVGATALGSFGGGLGYGPDGTNSKAAIGKSVAVKFDLASNAGEGSNSTGLSLNGAAPTVAGSVNLVGSGIDLHSGDVFQVAMGYDGTRLTVIITDTQTGRSATQSYAVDIVATAGSTAYVGFTGGTGVATATQEIVNWTFSPTAAQYPAAPSGLAATTVTTGSVSLAWTNNATNQAGFVVDRATDAAFTRNVVTQNLPAAATSLVDTAAGISPGTTYYYRIRATNAAGASANSATVSARTLTLPPISPVAALSSNRVTLSWQAPTGAVSYRIYRATASGKETLLASNITGTSWVDTTAVKGTKYFYVITAVNGNPSPLPSESAWSVEVSVKA